MLVRQLSHLHNYDAGAWKGSFSHFECQMAWVHDCTCTLYSLSTLTWVLANTVFPCPSNESQVAFSVFSAPLPLTWVLSGLWCSLGCVALDLSSRLICSCYSAALCCAVTWQEYLPSPLSLLSLTRCLCCDRGLSPVIDVINSCLYSGGPLPSQQSGFVNCSLDGVW